MTPSAQFTADEWSAVTEAPLLAAARVVAAERGGTMRENIAVRRVYSAARELHGESALLDALVASSPPLALQHMLHGDEPIAAGDARLQTALAAVRAKAGPADVD